MEASLAVRQLECLARSDDPALLAVLTEATNRVRAKKVVDAMRRNETALVNQFTATLETVLRDLGAHVTGVAMPIVDDSTFMERKWKSSLTTGQMSGLVERILTASKLKDWVDERLTPAFWKHQEQVQNTIAKTLVRAGLITNLTQTTINRILAAGGRRAGLVDIVGDTRKALFRVIEQAVDAGMNPRATARLMRDFIPEGRFVNAGSAYRAQLISRTETLHAQRQASLERYRANQVQMVMAFDGDSDEECAARDGSLFTLDDAETEMYATHPNCVLAFGPVGL